MSSTIPLDIEAPSPDSTAARPQLHQLKFEVLPTIDDVDSNKMTPLSASASAASLTSDPSVPREQCPTSAFYCHPTTRYSFDVQLSEKRPIVEVYRVDLENLEPVNLSRQTAASRRPCSVWPGRRSNQQSCQASTHYASSFLHPLRSLSRTQRFWAKLLIAAIIIGAAIAIGIGISKAVSAHSN